MQCTYRRYRTWQKVRSGDYIDQRRDLHDCFFLVGTEKKERISTVRYFLANYSSYFRAMLLETDMKEKNSKEDIAIPDHEPDVFRLMLSFVYGRHDIKFNNINQAMRFHILVDRCLMPKLKKISIKYLVENCKSNLCEVLECAVLLEIKEMEARAKTIVEKDTRALLSSPDFLNANPAIVEFIVKQEGLNVTEVELWRALVNWAKRQCGNKREGNILRKKVGNYPPENFIKHIQFLKMSLKEFAEEVVPTSILTPTETITVFVDMASGKGNTITEAASKTRHEWSNPIPTTCVVSLQFGGNITGYNQSPWECEYEIKNIIPTQMRISSIELMDRTSYSNSSWVHVKLMNINTNHFVASASFSLNHTNGSNSMNAGCHWDQTRSGMALPNIWQLASLNYTNGSNSMNAGCYWDQHRSGMALPNTLELTDNWLVEASKSYRLCIQTSNNSSFLNALYYGKDPSFVKDKSCDFCTLQFVSSSVQRSMSILSFVKSLKFSVMST